MPELTPRDDAKKLVSEILKRVDNLLKTNQFDQAGTELNKAKQLDPRNVYIYAYEERIASLLEQEKKRQAEAAKRAEEEARRKQEEEQRRLEEEKKRKEEEARRKIEEARRLQTEEEKRRKAEEERRRAAEKAAVEAKEKQQTQAPSVAKPHPTQATKAPQAVSDFINVTREEAIAVYKKALMDVWTDGATTREEELRLLYLRASLSITLEEHAVLQAEVKRETYYAKLKRGWASGLITSESSPVISDYQQQYRISPDEHKEIQAKVLAEIKSNKKKPVIMVIDDDQKMLDLLTETLSAEGYIVHPYTTTDEAYRAIYNSMPDLILSDINLETSTMGGFSFYEKVREIDELQDVPFVFLSGLTDEVLIRTGKELGVDDYITKPFSEQTLISVIKGKLRRYKQLKKKLKKT
ncbi:MAG TPA: response regulator [Bacteroidota bacterium]|nr:response regulator [Bacteroidota bacterium]